MTDTPTMRTSFEDGTVTIKMEFIDEDENSMMSDTEEIVPEMMVTVQVEEGDDQALDFSSTSKPPKKQSPNKKENQPQRRRKPPETPEERKERLERDRARKSWARQNESPEQRKARLDYHKKYKRKSRAKPKESQIPGADNKCSQCSAKFDSLAEWQEHIKTHPWKEDHFAKFRRSQPPEIMYDPLGESEKIIVKVEPIDFDDGSTSNTFETQQNDDIPNESDSTPNEFVTYLCREDLTYTTQCAIVNKMFKGRPINDICKLYNVTPQIVNELWDNREKYQVDKPGGSHRHLNAKVEESVLVWLQQQKDNHIQISGKMIQNAAEEFAKDQGFVTFDGSRKWLDRFKKKHHIMFGTRKRNYNATPDNKVKTQFLLEQWAEAREGMSDEDIYIADEVGLFYNSSKNRIQKLRGKKFVQGCVKDRLSIFLCTNASGTDKKKLLVCGTEDPLTNSHRDPHTLPALYIRHAQAHFTTKVFEDYVHCWNRELEQCNKKALLVLDRATIHTKLQLSNLKLLFVPYKSKNSLVPIRNGVYSRFRAEFRRLILEDKVMKCTSGLDRNISCLDALSMLEKAWERIPPAVITMSMFSIGYDVTMPEEDSVLTPKVTENDEETLCEILRDFDVEHYFTDITLLDEYLTVDDDLLTGQGTNASVFGGNHKANQKNEDVNEKPECSDTVKAHEMQDLIVRKYLQSNDTTFGTYRALMEVTQVPTCSNS